MFKKFNIKPLSLIFVLMLLFALGINKNLALAVSAEDLTEDLVDVINDSDLMNEIPEEAKGFLNELGISPKIEDAVRLVPRDFFRLIAREIKRACLKPIRITATSFGIALIGTLVYGLKTSFMESSVASVFSLVSVLSLVGFISPPIISLIKDTAIVIKSSCHFMLSLIPVMSALIASGGFNLANAGYTTMLFFFCQLVVRICSEIFVPIMSMYFALSITGSIMPDVSLSSLLQGIKKFVSWGLALLTTGFVSFLSIQTVVNVNADKLGFKTAKFLVGSFVPAIGTAISDALSTAYGCIGLIKNTLGGFGIVIIILSFMPILLKLSLWYFCLNITKELCLIIDAKEISKVLNGASFCVGILISVCFAIGLVLIVSVAVVMIWISP